MVVFASAQTVHFGYSSAVATPSRIEIVQVAGIVVQVARIGVAEIEVAAS